MKTSPITLRPAPRDALVAVLLAGAATLTLAGTSGASVAPDAHHSRVAHELSSPHAAAGTHNARVAEYLLMQQLAAARNRNARVAESLLLRHR